MVQLAPTCCILQISYAILRTALAVRLGIAEQILKGAVHLKYISLSSNQTSYCLTKCILGHSQHSLSYVDWDISTNQGIIRDHQPKLRILHVDLFGVFLAFLSVFQIFVQLISDKSESIANQGLTQISLNIPTVSLCKQLDCLLIHVDQSRNAAPNMPSKPCS